MLVYKHRDFMRISLSTFLLDQQCLQQTLSNYLQGCKALSIHPRKNHVEEIYRCSLHFAINGEAFSCKFLKCSISLIEHFVQLFPGMVFIQSSKSCL